MVEKLSWIPATTAKCSNLQDFFAGIRRNLQEFTGIYRNLQEFAGIAGEWLPCFKGMAEMFMIFTVKTLYKMCVNV